MNRRAFLGSAALAGFAGCLTDIGGGGGTPSGTPTAETDGYPPGSAVEETPPQRNIDTDAFERIDVEGTTVPLAPLDVAHYWFQRREARFADARGQRQYKRSRVLGAVLSPAPDGADDADPVARWPTGDRIVCYCGCPHHLSSLRAATLIENGYEEVYVIDEGFWAWHDQGYPMAGEDVTEQPRVQVVEGRTDPEHAGETAWATHDPSGQREAGPIAADGSFELHLRFTNVTPDSVVTLRTPATAVEAPLRELTGGTVTL